LYRAETRQINGLFRLKCVEVISAVWRWLAHLSWNNSDDSATAGIRAVVLLLQLR
jgi:hypothetical protein